MSGALLRRASTHGRTQNKEKILKKKRVVIMSDPHVGHRVGLTMPKRQSAIHGQKYLQIQRECWNYVDAKIKKLKPIDVLILNGDCIDGRGVRSGGTELIQPSVLKQADWCVEIIKHIGAKNIVIARGTDYHCSINGEDIEDYIAKEVGAKVGDHEFVDINGLVFDIKHHLGNTSIPHGKGTAISREWLWNGIWAAHEAQPKADVIIRSHVHWCLHIGDPGEWLGIVTPALQAMGSKFGARQCSGFVDFGFIHFDIKSKEDFLWQAHKFRILSQKATVTKL